MKCCECGDSYHLGGCAGIADSTFKTMGVAKRDKWRCRACRSGNRLSTDGSVAGDSQADHATLLAQVGEICKKLELLSSLKDNVDRLLPLPTKVDDLLSLKPTVEYMKEAVNSMQESVQFFSEKYDSLLALVVSQEKEVKALRTEVSTLQSTVTSQAQSIQRLQGDLNDLEQYDRRPNMEIHGLPLSPGENLEASLCELAQKLSIAEFTASDVVAIHRLPGKRDLPPPVLVRFVSVRRKEPWISARMKLRSLPARSSDAQLFFNDNLTRANKELFWQARSSSKTKGYKFVWLKNCRILVRKREGDPVLQINCTSDLDKIV